MLPYSLLCEDLMSTAPVILFYQGECSLCPPAAEAVASRAAELGVPILIRKPSIEELRSGKIPGYPALFIPAGTLALERPYMLVGQGLETLLDQLLSSTDG